MKFTRKQIVPIAGILVGIGIGFQLFPISTSAESLSLSAARDCDKAAVINCGVLNSTELVKAYNESSSVQSIYKNIGISKTEIESTGEIAKTGYITNNGLVMLSKTSEPIARNVDVYSLSDARSAIKLQGPAGTYYQTPAQDSISNKSAPAFVFMKDNHFQFAVLASNGDPVSLASVPSAKKLSARSTSTSPKKTAAQPAVVLVNTGSTTNTAVYIFIGATILGLVCHYQRQLRRISISQ